MSDSSYAQRDLLLRQLGFESYTHYLLSDLWKEIRDSVLTTCPHCRLCTNKATVVHHRDYKLEVLTGEDRSDTYLVGLCNRCHYLVEFDPKGNKRDVAQAERRFRQLYFKGRRLTQLKSEGF